LVAQNVGKFQSLVLVFGPFGPLIIR